MMRDAVESTAVELVSDGDELRETRVKTGLFVMGMHRSGTSLVASAIARLGFHVGSEPLAPQPDNPAGYFEDRRIVEIHDRFLEECGRTWSDPRSLPSEAFEGPAAVRAREALGRLMTEDFVDRPRWLVKDPRLCRLLPLWSSWLAEPGPETEISFLHVVRSPRAVARSLASRDGISHSRSLLLWLTHCLECERSTRGYKRSWVRFEDLVREGSEPLQAPVAQLLGDQIGPRDLQRAFGAVFDTGQVHHTPDLGEEGAHPWLQRTETALGHLLDGEDERARGQLDAVRGELDVAETLLLSDGWVWATEHHQERYEVVSRRIEQTNLQIEHLGNLLSSLVVASPVLATPPLFANGVAPAEVSVSDEPSDRSVELVPADALTIDLTRIAREVAELVSSQLNLSDRLQETLALARRLEGEAAAANSRWAESIEALERSRRKLARLEVEQQEILRLQREQSSEVERLEKERLTLMQRAAQDREEAARGRAEAAAAVEERHRLELRLEREAGQRDLTREELEVLEAQRDRAILAGRLSDQQIQILESSLSWRLTRPLRWIRRLGRKG